MLAAPLEMVKFCISGAESASVVPSWRRMPGRFVARLLSPHYSTLKKFGLSVSKVTRQKWQKKCSISASPSLLCECSDSTGKTEGDIEGFGYGFF